MLFHPCGVPIRIAQLRNSYDYGAQHFRPHSELTSTLIYDLIDRYQTEGLTMLETLEEYGRRRRRELMQEITHNKEEQMKFLQELTQDKETQLKFVETLPPEVRVIGMTPEELEALAEKIRKQQSSSDPDAGA